MNFTFDWLLFNLIGGDQIGDSVAGALGDRGQAAYPCAG
jgi:hypothetical protein